MSDFALTLALHNLTTISPIIIFVNIVFLFPFFWVWLLSLLIWFFLELSVYFSHFFNTKHSYDNENLNNVNLNIFYTILTKSYKFNFLKKIYILYF